MIRRARGATLRRMDITIELHERNPPAGRVRVDGRPPTPFAGWLTLLAILERVVEDQPRPTAAGVDG